MSQNNSDLCLTCHKNTITHLIIPCGHFVLCSVCSSAENFRKCPKCNNVASAEQSTVRVIFQDHDDDGEKNSKQKQDDATKQETKNVSENDDIPIYALVKGEESDNTVAELFVPLLSTISPSSRFNLVSSEIASSPSFQCSSCKLGFALFEHPHRCQFCNQVFCEKCAPKVFCEIYQPSSANDGSNDGKIPKIATRCCNTEDCRIKFQKKKENNETSFPIKIPFPNKPSSASSAIRTPQEEKDFVDSILDDISAKILSNENEAILSSLTSLLVDSIYTSESRNQLQFSWSDPSHATLRVPSKPSQDLLQNVQDVEKMASTPNTAFLPLLSSFFPQCPFYVATAVASKIREDNNNRVRNSSFAVIINNILHIAEDAANRVKVGRSAAQHVASRLVKCIPIMIEIFIDNTTKNNEQKTDAADKGKNSNSQIILEFVKELEFCVDDCIQKIQDLSFDANNISGNSFDDFLKMFDDEDDDKSRNRKRNIEPFENIVETYFASVHRNIDLLTLYAEGDDEDDENDSFFLAKLVEKYLYPDDSEDQNNRNENDDTANGEKNTRQGNRYQKQQWSDDGIFNMLMHEFGGALDYVHHQKLMNNTKKHDKDDDDDYDDGHEEGETKKLLLDAMRSFLNLQIQFLYDEKENPQHVSGGFSPRNGNNKESDDEDDADVEQSPRRDTHQNGETSSSTVANPLPKKKKSTSSACCGSCVIC